ncbi:MAG TPA: hypothetical protein VK698_37110 [Kofleriaceae bacterium]|nr:hypothetical protein [Kofleriaceae bacterium]
MSDLVADMRICFERGYTDGLPVVPPYSELVDEMLAALGWSASDVLAVDEELRLEIRAEQLASIAVMAGCEPAYARVLRAIGEMLLAPTFNLRGVATTTGGVAVLVILAGPVVGELELATGSNALGAPVRSGATIGRFAQMVRHICGRAGGLLDEFGTIGHPGRLSYCVAERQDTMWPGFQTQFGFDAGESCVGVMAAEGPNSVNNHYAETGEHILETIAHGLAHWGTTNFYYQGGGYLVLIAPEHMRLVAAEFSREAARQFLFERAVALTRDLARIGRIPRGIDKARNVDLDAPRSPVAHQDQITFIESGGSAGKFSAIIPGWVANVTHVKGLAGGRVALSRKGVF